MKKLLLLLTAGMMLAVSVGCMYSGAVADGTGKLYVTRANLNGLWNSAFMCEPNGGNLNCKEVTMMGTGGGEAAADADTAPPPAVDEAGAEAEEAVDTAADDAAAE